MIGIYKIKNNVNNKVYIGSSNDIERRFRKHKTELNCGKHYNEHLGRAYKKYGKDAFSFEILELCDLESLMDKECFYMLLHNALEEGYNMTRPRMHPHLKNPEKYSALMSKAMMGKTPSNFESMQKSRWTAVDVYKDGVFFRTFDSQREVERFLGVTRGNVYNFLKGKTPSLKGFEEYDFKYKE